MLPFGLPKLAWLKMLKNSLLNSITLFSPILVRFINVTSKMMSPGPWKTLRPRLPKRPALVSTGFVPQFVARINATTYSTEEGIRECCSRSSSRSVEGTIRPTKCGVGITWIVELKRSGTYPSGRSLPAPDSDRSVGSVIASGVPVCRTVTPLICQPPDTLPANPFCD